jgi:hypothetical protein
MANEMFNGNELPKDLTEDIGFYTANPHMIHPMSIDRIAHKAYKQGLLAGLAMRQFGELNSILDIGAPDTEDLESTNGGT